MNNRPQTHYGATTPIRRAPGNAPGRPASSPRPGSRPVQGTAQRRPAQRRPAAAPRQAISPARTGAQRPAGARRAPARQPGWLDAPGRKLGLLRLGVIAALVIYTALVLGGATARNLPFAEIDAAMSSTPGLEALFRMDANAFQERFGATPDGLEGWMLYGGNSVMEVSELLVAKSPDSAALDRLEDAVSARLDDQQNSFRNYGTNQIDLLEHAIVLRRGPYLFYGVSESVEAWEDRFLGLVR